MIPSLVLLQLGLVAAAPITISSVDAVREGGRLAITVRGDAMIDPEAASTKMAEGRLYLFVRDARVREANRAWGEGASEIRAHRHPHEVELVVPLDDVRCRGSVEFDKSAEGLRAYVSCEEKAPARAAAPTDGRAKAASAKPTPKALDAAPVMPSASASASASAKRHSEIADDHADADADGKRLRDADADGKRLRDERRARTAAPVVVARAAQDAVALKAALVLQPPAKVPDKAADKPVVVQPGPAPAKASAGAPAAMATTQVADFAAPAGVPSPAAPAGAQGTAREGDAAGGKSSGGNGGMLLAGVLLAGLAFAAFHFTRRRAAASRYIQIVESASLGPKRSIVVARVGESTMILGSSEAGITLLKALPPGAAAGHAAVHAPAPAPVASRPVLVKDEGATTADSERAAAAEAPSLADDIPVDDLGFDDPTPTHQGGGLIARFFRRGDGIAAAGSESFEDVLGNSFEDSLEDQELRRKLSLGLAGRAR